MRPRAVPGDTEAIKHPRSLGTSVASRHPYGAQMCDIYEKFYYTKWYTFHFTKKTHFHITMVQY